MQIPSQYQAAMMIVMSVFQRYEIFTEVVRYINYYITINIYYLYILCSLIRLKSEVLKIWNFKNLAISDLERTSVKVYYI